MLGACANHQIPRQGPDQAVPSGPPVALLDVRPFFVVGETITWELTYHGIEGGRARLAVGSPGVVEGRRVLGVTAEAESSGLLAVVKQLRDAAATWIDLESGLPVTTESEAVISGNRLRVETHWRRSEPAVDMRVSRQAAPVRKVVRRLPLLETHDPLSALLLIRSWRAPVGSHAVLYALGGQRLWRTQIRVEGREEVTGRLGDRPAVRMSGTSTRLTSGLRDDLSKPPRTFTLWLSNDDERIPLRILARTELGPVEITATSYQTPAK